MQVSHMNISGFSDHLCREEKSAATREKYLRDAEAFCGYAEGRDITKELVAAWKKQLVERGYAVCSVNSMLASVNSLLDFLGLPECRVKNIRIQRQTYCAEDKELTKAEYPDIPYILFGHSMGSFMTRTVLAKYPDCGIAGAVICGTGWMPTAVLKAGKALGDLLCKLKGEQHPSETLQKVMFGSYNQRVEHPRTAYDWLNRDAKAVDLYVADHLCGFTASAGLARDMLTGILYIQQPESLAAMSKDLPVFFIAGGDDPVGDYGKGVRQAAAAFRNAGMKHVSERIYPLCRHEILNEINKAEVYEDVYQWLQPLMKAE